MGAFQCAENEDRLFLKILERKMDERETHLDKKIHNEFLKLKKNPSEEGKNVIF